jgi:hypothetical protein
MQATKGTSGGENHPARALSWGKRRRLSDFLLCSRTRGKGNTVKRFTHKRRAARHTEITREPRCTLAKEQKRPHRFFAVYFDEKRLQFCEKVL